MLGPSGSGKTTTLRMIAGFELPTAGRVLLHGRGRHARSPPFERDVNTVFQDYALFPHMTVGDNVALRAVIRKVPKAERERAGRRGAARWSASTGYDRRKPGQLSGGQRQRVALARALVNRPRVLLLDEPLGALDLKLREEMQIELKAIQQQVGITFIYVTHDQEEALTMSDRIAVFNQGRIEQIGAPGRGLRAARDAVRGRASSAPRTCSPARPPQAIVGSDGHVHRPAREDPPRPSRTPSRRPTRSARRARSARSSTSARTRATSWTSTRARELVVTQQNLATTSTEALAQQGRRVRLIWKRQHCLPVADGGPTVEEETPAHEDRSRHPGARRRPWRCSPPACSGGATRLGRPRAPPAVDRRRARASSTWSSGPATPSAARSTRPSTGSPRSRTKTGCKVNTTDMTDSNNGVSLHAVGRLRRQLGLGRRDDPPHRRAASWRRSTPTSFPNYANVFEGLKNMPTTPSTASTTACPHGRGPNLLVYNTEAITTAPTTWDPVWEGGADYGGKISIYDSSIYIADAALHLMAKQPELGHQEPVPAQPGAVRRRDRAARAAARRRRHCTGASYSRPDRLVRRRRRRRRDDLAVPGQPAAGPTASRSRASSRRGLHRAGPTPG